MKEKTLAVIIPSIFPFEYLGELLDTVFSASCSCGLEVTVYCLKMGSDYGLEFVQNGNVKTYYLKEILPVGSARNYLFNLTSEDYITFVDDDDLLVEDRFFNFSKLVIDDSVDVYVDNISSVMFCDDVSIILDRTVIGIDAMSQRMQGTLSAFNFIVNRIGFSKPIYKRRFLIENEIYHEPKLMRGEDLLFRLDCVLKRGVFRFASHIGYVYRVRKASLSGKNIRHQKMADRKVIKKLVSEGYYFSAMFYCGLAFLGLRMHAEFFSMPFAFVYKKVFLCLSDRRAFRGGRD